MWARTVLTTTVLVTAAVLMSCGGSATEVVSPDGDVHLPTAGRRLAGLPGAEPPRRRDGREDEKGVQVPVDYALLEAREGGCLPVRFNPCEPIHYVSTPPSLRPAPSTICMSHTEAGGGDRPGVRERRSD